ncbi:MAG: choice-of-anchor D domain-containing protein [Myxococcaceae bacterium]|nr:choice-of-anchor D domain-containing protein [Myxococcaceae bacterium]
MSRLMWIFALSAVTACKCGQISTVPPTVAWSPSSLSFGAVRVGESTVRSVKLEALTATPVEISAITVMSGNLPGGADGFTVKIEPITVDRGTAQSLAVTFKPTVRQEYGATLILTTNDEEHQTVRIGMFGEGAEPIMTVTADCDVGRMCVGTAVESPPSIDFGAEPFMRPVQLDTSRLPQVDITNDGLVAMTITRLQITGADPAAFTIASGMPTLPLVKESMEGVNVPIRFRPLNETQMSYSAQLVIEGDDPMKPSVTVPLVGTLAPNLAPVVCANLIEVAPPLGCATRDYRPEWPMLLTVPAGGYDFRSSRPVEPGSTVKFSASSADGVTTCTTDPETARVGLTYRWEVVGAPAGSPGFTTGTMAEYTLSPAPTVPGDYEVRLTVTDPQLHATTVQLRFSVARTEDLIVRLEWPGFAATDLDLHLVRPSATTAGSPFSGAFSYFDPVTKTSGDLNGYANLRLPVWGAGTNFEWGGQGLCDNPRLNLDDTGSGGLVEDISLMNPERDAKCDGGRCSYKVFVHYFNDTRPASPTACVADGTPDCNDGESCTCAAGSKCVAPPPNDGGRPLGAGECRAAPKPVVKVYLKGSSTPAATIPLPPTEVMLGAPCTMFYAADVSWPSQQETGSLPDGGTPPATVIDRTDAGFARFGRRQVGDLRQCRPDDTMTQWFNQTP